MLKPPRNAQFEIDTMNKKVFLTGVLGRLKNDAGTYIDYVKKRNESSGEGIGFWGSVRLLMPVVEAVANVYDKTPDVLLGELGVKTPKLMWILYRHSLMHNDLLQHGRYNGIDATWGISMFGLNHIIQDEVIGLDTLCLYNSFVEYLENKISETADGDEVEIITGVIWDKPDADIIREFNLLAPKRLGTKYF